MKESKQKRYSVAEEDCTRGISSILRKSEDYDLHWHSFFEIEIVVSGSAVHTLNSEEYEIGRGSAYILSPIDFHKITDAKGLKLWHIVIDEANLSPSRILELSSGAKRFTLSAEALRSALMLARLISSECSRGGGCEKELCESLLTVILREGEAKRHSSQEITGIKKAILFMGLHFRENLTLSQVAAQAGFHPYYFSELFKKVTGENFSGRLNTLRIGYAKELLSSGFSVSEACFGSGFGSLSNFLTVFKKSTGMTPVDYKKMEV